MAEFVAILIGMAIGCSGLVLARVLDWLIKWIDRNFGSDPSCWTPGNDDLEDQYK